MSAPTTPAEMADWLEAQRRLDILPDEMTLDIIAYLRRQPTDAQKIEALTLLGDASDAGSAYADEFKDCQREPWRWEYQRYWPMTESAVFAFRQARRALRLLGLPTE